MSEQSQTPTPEQKSKWRKYAVLAGFILALVCKALPQDYRAVCQTLASFCTGGF